MMLKYAWAALAILVAVNSVMFPWLDGPERAGLLVAAAITFPVQVLAFALLAKHAAILWRAWSSGSARERFAWALWSPSGCR